MDSSKFIPVKAAVLGDGGWGTAQAIMLAQNGHDVTLWGAFADNIEAIRRDKENRRFLPGVKFPDKLKVTANIGEAVKGASIVVMASPSQFLRGTLNAFKPYFKREKQILLDISKGIEVGTLLRMSELTAEILGKAKYAVLSGPSHAEEVSRNIPTAVVAASNDLRIAKHIQSVFMNDMFRVYTSRDVAGVELGGALKNVYAVAAGMLDGMGLGDNTKAALMTRGIAEMARLGKRLNGQQKTFSGLSGAGDLIVTCTSKHSRNNRAGQLIGQGVPALEAIEQIGTVEGYECVKIALKLAREKDVDIPIFEQLYKICYEGLTPKEALQVLMQRPQRHEQECYWEV